MYFYEHFTKSARLADFCSNVDDITSDNNTLEGLNVSKNIMTESKALNFFFVEFPQLIALHDHPICHLLAVMQCNHYFARKTSDSK